MLRISFPDGRWFLPQFLAGILFLAFPISAPLAAPDQDLAAIRRTGEAFVHVSRKVTPSVVNIRTFRKVPRRGLGLQDPFFGDMFEPFRDFFGREFGERFRGPGDGEMVQTSLGSGVIVRPEGILLTNNHVIEGAEEIRVTLNDRREVGAVVVGSDPRTDIAVLRLPPGKYPWVSLGDSDAIQIGEWAVAIGNPFGLGQSVTVGVVSAKGRANVGITDLEDFLQTDAAINPGNSGGPLINLDGEVIGINTAIFSKSGGYQGIGFAIPSNLATLILDSLLKTGRVVRSDLTVSVKDRVTGGTKAGKGVVVSEVVPGGFAQKAGISTGDVIVRVNGRDVEDSVSFYRIVSLLPVGETVPVDLVRNGTGRRITVTVGELPARPRDSEILLQTALGFSVEELTENVAETLGYRYERGVLVTRVTRLSQADSVGLEPGDLVVKINGRPTPDLEAFREAFEAVQWGRKVLVEYRREGVSRTVRMTLEK